MRLRPERNKKKAQKKEERKRLTRAADKEIRGGTGDNEITNCRDSPDFKNTPEGGDKTKEEEGTECVAD